MESTNLQPPYDLIPLFERRLEVAKNVCQRFKLSKNELLEWQQAQRRNIIKETGNNSVYYNRLWSETFPDMSIEEIAELPHDNLPFTTRQDLIDNYPFGMIASPIKDIVRYGESTGTTGNSISASYTADDWIENNVTVVNHLSSVITKEDVVAVAVPYELAGVGQDLDRALEIVGATTIAVGALTRFCPPERVLDILHRTEATVLVCSATRALFLAGLARERKLDPLSNFKLRAILCVGEGMSDAKRKKVQAAWDVEVYSMYGMTETNTLAMFCSSGHLHLTETKALFEIIDPVTSDILPDGEAGELVVSTLTTHGLPMVRYRTGDLCTILPADCDCGLNTRRLVHHGRLTDTISVDGIELRMLDIDQLILSSIPGFYYGLYIQDATLYIALVPPENQNADVRKALIKAMQDKYGITPKVVGIRKECVTDIVRNALKPSIKNILVNEADILDLAAVS